jgi:hypothetical protein
MDLSAASTRAPPAPKNTHRSARLQMRVLHIELSSAAMRGRRIRTTSMQVESNETLAPCAHGARSRREGRQWLHRTPATLSKQRAVWLKLVCTRLSDVFDDTAGLARTKLTA